MQVKWATGVGVLSASVLATALFCGLALLGNEARLRNDEWSPDDPDGADD